MSALVQDFLEHEADLLDGRRYREWLELFAPDSYYWIPIHPDQDDPRAMPSHVFEKRPVLAARVERLYDTRVIPQQPASRTSRLIGAVRIEGEHAAGPIARVKFQIVEARTTHEVHNDVRIFAGTARYALIPNGSDFKIAWKRVDVIDSEAGTRGIAFMF